MRWRRLLFVIVLAFFASALAAPSPFLAPTPTAEASTQTVALGQISITVPTKWEFRPMPSGTEARMGVQAAEDLTGLGIRAHPQLGLEAWYVDASRLPVPTDYYYLAAEGPAMRSLPSGRICSQQSSEVLTDRAPLFDRTLTSPGDYVATAGGTCWARGRVMRWAAFVAAPGYGPVRSVGIPESGLYFAYVMLPDGPYAGQRAELILSQVAFGGTPVADFLRVARTQKL